MELEFGNHNVKISCLEPCLVVLNGMPNKVLPAGSHTLKLRQYEGKVEIDAPPKAKVNIDVKSKVSQKGERLDDLPPPPPPPADNYLAMLREKVRQQMGVTRENFERIPSPYEEAYGSQWEEEVLEEMRNPTSEPEPEPEPEQQQQDSPTAESTTDNNNNL